MSYKIVERNIGRAGNKRQMLAKQEEWDNRYGKGNWKTGYEIDGRFFTRDEAIRDIYDNSYILFLEGRPDLVKQLEESGGVFNPHAILSNSVDIQAASVERYMAMIGLTFQGTRKLPIGSYQPQSKYTKRDRLQQARELGLEIYDDRIQYPEIAYTLSPFKVPCSLNPSISIEAFWQSDIKCLAVKQ